jgi:hypothetical protein
MLTFLQMKISYFVCQCKWSKDYLIGDLAADDSIRKKKITVQYCLQFLTVFEVYLYIITKYGTNILWAG